MRCQKNTEDFNVETRASEPVGIVASLLLLITIIFLTLLGAIILGLFNYVIPITKKLTHWLWANTITRLRNVLK